MGVLVAGAFVISCGAADVAPANSGDTTTTAVVVVDDAGREIRLSSPAERVLSLVPARTDVIIALGAADRLVARTRWDEDPRLADLPSIDNALLPSLEWVAARRPDLVVAWPDAQSRAVVSRLRGLGVAVYASGVETLAETRRSIQDLGTLLGLDARADSLLAAIEAMHDSARAAVANRPRRTVAYLVGLDPPMVAGPGTFSHELLGIAGGDNVFADAGQPWPQISLEALIRRDPDVLIVTVPPERDVAAEFAARTGWRELTAVRTGGVHVVDPDVLNRPGPSVGPAALILARLIHPEAFGNEPADDGAEATGSLVLALPASGRPGAAPRKSGPAHDPAPPRVP